MEGVAALAGAASEAAAVSEVAASEAGAAEVAAAANASCGKVGPLFRVERCAAQGPKHRTQK